MRLDGRELTVRAWEARLGREGVWCGGCCRATPVAHLQVEGALAHLECEGCARLLAAGESWLGEVLRRLPLQRQGQTVRG